MCQERGSQREGATAENQVASGPWRSDGAPLTRRSPAGGHLWHASVTSGGCAPWGNGGIVYSAGPSATQSSKEKTLAFGCVPDGY